MGRRIGGVVVILFGLATLVVIRIPWFYADTRIPYQGRAGTFANSALMGLVFAAGWSPCIGAILTMGMSQDMVGQAMLFIGFFHVHWRAVLSYRSGRGIAVLPVACVLSLVPAYLGYLSGHSLRSR